MFFYYDPLEVSDISSEKTRFDSNFFAIFRLYHWEEYEVMDEIDPNLYMCVFLTMNMVSIENGDVLPEANAAIF